LSKVGFRPTGFTDVLNELQPDLIVVPGDRFEIFAAVAAALMKERIQHEKGNLRAGAPGHNGARPQYWPFSRSWCRSLNRSW